MRKQAHFVRAFSATAYESRVGAAWLMLSLLTTSVVACQGQMFREPPVHPNLNMDFQARVDPQESDPFFADKRGMRIPPAGTVATSPLRDDVHLQEDDLLFRGISNGQFSAALPPSIPLTEESLARGKERYGIYCAVCHAGTGAGNGVAVQRGLLQPPSYHEQRLRELPVGYFYSVITNGVRSMSSYKAQIPVVDRWLIAAYVKALQVSQQAPLALVPSDVASSKGWR